MEVHIQSKRTLGLFDEHMSLSSITDLETCIEAQLDFCRTSFTFSSPMMSIFALCAYTFTLPPHTWHLLGQFSPSASL